MNIRGITRPAHDAKLKSADKAVSEREGREDQGPPIHKLRATFARKGVGVIHKTSGPRSKGQVMLQLTDDEIASVIRKGIRVKCRRVHVLPQ